jgi:mono/diheme cytochrome c family protein
VKSTYKCRKTPPSELVTARSMNLTHRLAYVFLGLVTLLPVGLKAQADPVEGEKLFKANCASCHAVDKKVVGPALKGYKDRIPGGDWIYNWIHNSTAMIKAGDAYAVKISTEYNGSVMTAMPQLDKTKIDNILAYVDAYVPPVTKNPPPTELADGSGLGKIEPVLYYGLLTLLGSLVIIAFALVFLIVVAVHAIRARDSGKPFELNHVFAGFRRAATSKFVVTGITLLVVAGGTNFLVKSSRGVGLHQGYAPAQPIAFSHKVHAGQYGISCNYCHLGVEKGKLATIPGTHICMNCHTYIQEGPAHGKTEIGKIRTAHYNNQRVEWVRIHNLPDLVYFNHAQHVKVGGVECTSCHGEVKEMEVVYQFSDLSMGWCITCHRETKVDVTKNDYYLKVHNEMQGKEEAIHVAELGGLECSKCHY